ncbi:atlastin-1-like isoform X1 [Amphibalanus amphitrite]|uniref:atlastin-1-like isoform X1 n=2 Tax=Amphibalanus amphitrite TaxID=1232801 RepID=UPI001C8FD41F|nr:atlastin-1-like isoform X1 [Amphibalanus amphitrite]
MAQHGGTPPDNATVQNNATPEAMQILTASGKGGFVLDSKNLKSILLADDIIDKPAVVISVAGAFRKGKSFLLDMMLRYLTASDKSNWIHEQSQRGFPWRSGFRRHTTGILMWSKPIPVTLSDGTGANILLMDTQGTFDNKSTVHESSTVFALSTLLSSLQIYNITGNLQNDDLEHLQLFTEYGRLALDDTSSKPFQKLLILVRDWQYAHELPLGAGCGSELIKEWLDTPTGKKELEKVRTHIRGCFGQIEGFLLPHPGQNVASSPNFTGSSAEMDPVFVEKLNELMPQILAPEKMTVKSIAGNSVTAGQLFTFFETYANLFQSDKLPKPKNIMQATAEANNMAAAQDAKTQYIKEMEFLHSDDHPSLEQTELLGKHQEASEKAMKAFTDRKKMGDWKLSENYRLRLMKDIEEWYKFAERANNTKRQKERLNAENHNLGLIGTCKMTYINAMEEVAGEDVGFVPQKELDSAHEEARRKAMDQFKEEQKVFEGIEKDSQFALTQEIDNEFRRMLFHNDVKKDAKNFKAAQANMKAVGQAKRNYLSMMNAMTDGVALTVEELQKRHEKSMEVAVDLFESLKEGDERIAEGYLENMKDDIQRELESYLSANRHKQEMKEVQEQVLAITKQLEDAKKQRKPGCTIL